MKNTYVRVKGIIKKDDTYLLIKRWVDDHIPDPFVWEFIDAEVAHGKHRMRLCFMPSRSFVRKRYNRENRIHLVAVDRRDPLCRHCLSVLHHGGG